MIWADHNLYETTTKAWYYNLNTAALNVSCKVNLDYACFEFMINKFDQTFGASNGVDTVRQQEIFPWPIDVATTIRTTLVVAPAIT